MVTIQRIRDNGTLTMGRLSVWDNEMRLFECVTLEPSWILNESFISCIPTGSYTAKKRESNKFGKHIHITEVPERSYILIHTLNYFKQTEGCIGVGKRFQYLNDDNVIDITDSQSTLDNLLTILPLEFNIKVSNHNEFQTFY